MGPRQKECRPVTAPSPDARHGAFVASLRRFPRGLAHPVTLTFLIAAYFSYVSGDTVRAAYLLAVGLALGWDRARRAAGVPGAAAPDREHGGPGRLAVFSHESAERRRAAMSRLLIPATLAAAAYAVLVGSFQRYSWPATIAVCIPATAGVIVAWWVSAGSGTEPERLSRPGVAAWAVVWVGVSVWELTALYLQPSLTTDSPAHPTLSYLADPVLASVPGRAVVLFGWLAFGWYLARR
jgi:hypothetical protein